MPYISLDDQMQVIIGMFVMRIERRCTSPHKARLIEWARVAYPNGYIPITQMDAPTQALIKSRDIVAHQGFYVLNRKYRQEFYIEE